MKRIESLGFCSRFFLVGGWLLSTFFPPLARREGRGNRKRFFLSHSRAHVPRPFAPSPRRFCTSLDV